MAYCYATGRIEFGSRLPKGALPIARGRERKVRARIASITRCGHDGDPRVPGVPEAANQAVAVEALERFTTALANEVTSADRVTVFRRAHRWPIAGRGKLA